MIRRPPRSTQSRSSAASDVYKRQVFSLVTLLTRLNGHLPPVFLKVLLVLGNREQEASVASRAFLTCVHGLREVAVVHVERGTLTRIRIGSYKIRVPVANQATLRVHSPAGGWKQAQHHACEEQDHQRSQH